MAPLIGVHLPGEGRAEAIGRWLVLLVLVGLMVTPPLAVAGQVGLVALVLCARRARALVAATWQEPLVKLALLFLAVVAVGVTYSAAGWREGWLTLWGWRKLLLLPLALAFFGPMAARRWLVAGFVAATVLAVLVSFVCFFFRIPLPTYAVPGVFGIVARNHSTQGALFSAAVLGAAWLAAFTHWPQAWQRRLCIAAAVLVAANIFFVTPGRSGYVVLLVGAGVLVLGWAAANGRGLRRGLLAAALLVAALLAGLVAVPASRVRIAQAVDELVTYQDQKELTSMGIRVVFWRNALALVGQKPLLGWGTGGFEAAYKTIVTGQEGVRATVTRDPHNQYLAIVAQHGLAGLAVFLAFLVAAFRQRAPIAARALGLAILTAWCTTALANSHFATFAEGTFLFVWMGVLLGRQGETTG